MKIELSVGKEKAAFEGGSEAAILRAAKTEAAKRAPFALRIAIGAMSDLTFAAQVVSRANKSNGRNDPAPQSAREFLDWATSRGYARVLES